MLKQGLEFATLSNYYPSAPYYPLSSIRENTFKLRQESYICNGELIYAPLDFRRQFADWGVSSSMLPDAPGERIFPNPPPGLLEAPNAEHHWFSDYNVYLHITAPGSLLTTGQFDCGQPPRTELETHGIKLGCPLPWRQAYDAMFANLMIPDGGGAVIVHPHWSHLPIAFLNEMLDYDSRVLGIEVFNYDAESEYAGTAEDLWDAVLSGGRQCFGFCVQDHLKDEWRGRSILLPRARTAEECLRAYREGRFYGAVLGRGLRFEYLGFDGRTVRARCDKPAFFQLISRSGVVLEVLHQSELVYTLPESERGKHGFLRLTAYPRKIG